MKKQILFFCFFSFMAQATPVRLTVNNNTGVQLQLTAQCVKPNQEPHIISLLLDPIDAQRTIEDKSKQYMIFKSEGVCNIQAVQSDAGKNIKFFGQLGLDEEQYETPVPTKGFAIPTYKNNLTWILVGRGLVDDGINPPFWDVTYTLENPESFIY